MGMARAFAKKHYKSTSMSSGHNREDENDHLGERNEPIKALLASLKSERKNSEGE
jgi:hypothetical protein